jgi:hypothetical protein
VTDALKNDLLAAYDDQLRGTSETADVPTTTDGPVIPCRPTCRTG